MQECQFSFQQDFYFAKKLHLCFQLDFSTRENCIFCCPLSALCQEAVYWDVGTEFCSKYSQVSCQPLSSNTIFANSKLWDNCRKYISTLESNDWFKLSTNSMQTCLLFNDLKRHENNARRSQNSNNNRCYAVTQFRGILLVTHLVFDSFRLVGDSGGN